MLCIHVLVNETLGPTTCVAPTDVEPRSDHLCSLLDCQHGLCEEFAGGARCVCAAGWIGMDCMSPSVSIQLDLNLRDYITERDDYPEPPAPVIRRSTSDEYTHAWDEEWAVRDTDRIVDQDGKVWVDDEEEEERERREERHETAEERASDDTSSKSSSASDDDTSSKSSSSSDTSSRSSKRGSESEREPKRESLHRQAHYRTRPSPPSSHRSSPSHILSRVTFSSPALPHNLTTLSPLQSIVFYFMNEDDEHMLDVELYERNGTGGSMTVALAYDRARDYVEAKQVRMSRRVCRDMRYGCTLMCACACICVMFACLPCTCACFMHPCTCDA